MSKIYIVGSVASGKTTLAKELSRKTGIPHFELDCIVHVNTGSGRYKRTPDEQVEEINRINGLGDWIIEGTYRKSCTCLLEMAEEIIYLDTPLWLRKYRILTRYIKQKLHLEPCHYKSDFTMLKMMYKWTKDFEQNREQFEMVLEQYKDKSKRIKSIKSIV